MQYAVCVLSEDSTHQQLRIVFQQTTVEVCTTSLLFRSFSAFSYFSKSFAVSTNVSD